MAEVDEDDTARGHLGEAAKGGLSAVKQAAGKAADVVWSAVRGGAEAGQDGTDASTQAALGASNGSLEPVRPTPPARGEMQPVASMTSNAQEPAMAETGVDDTARGHLGEATKEGLNALKQAAGKAADVPSRVMRSDEARQDAATAAGSRAALSAAKGGLELVQQTTGAMGGVQREIARQSVEGMAELGKLFANLLDEQLQHNVRVAMTLSRAMNVNWDEIVRAQSES